MADDSCKLRDHPSRHEARRRCVWLAMLVVVILGSGTARAEFLYRQVSLTQLSQRAAIIVQGRVIEARYEGLTDYPHVATVMVTLEVEQMLRGPAERRYSFRQYLPGGLQARRGKPEYAVGQRLLLFLPQPSRYGLSSPLGREQGLFLITRDRQGKELVQNGFGNAGLFRDAATTAAKLGASLSPAQLRLTTERRGPVPLEDFVSLVHLLSRNQ